MVDERWVIARRLAMPDAPRETPFVVETRRVETRVGADVIAERWVVEVVDIVRAMIWDEVCFDAIAALVDDAFAGLVLRER